MFIPWYSRGAQYTLEHKRNTVENIYGLLAYNSSLCLHHHHHHTALYSCTTSPFPSTPTLPSFPADADTSGLLTLTAVGNRHLRSNIGGVHYCTAHSV